MSRMEEEDPSVQEDGAMRRSVGDVGSRKRLWMPLKSQKQDLEERGSRD